MQPWRELAARFYQLVQAKAAFLNSGHWALLALSSHLEGDYGYVRSEKGFACLFRPFGHKWQLRQTWIANEGQYYTINREGCASYTTLRMDSERVFVQQVERSGRGLGGLFHEDSPEGKIRSFTPEQAFRVLTYALDAQCNVEAVCCKL